jgi:AbrB family looped-hinge helix DNA binding protein
MSWYASSVSHKDRYVVRVGDRGRLVLPAALRRHLDVEAGDELLALVEDDDAVRLVSRAAAIRLARGSLHAPGRSLADELIAERRAEAAAEDRS